MKGTKKDKERVTILLTANATGTHKLKPLFIGRSKQPRAFGKVKMNDLPHISYRNNRTAWMTMVRFSFSFFFFYSRIQALSSM
jgi:DDE superfamily endonuclease